MFLGQEKFFHPPLLSWFGRCRTAARIFYDDIPRAYRTGILALNTLLLLSIFDALIGGGISSGLRYDGGGWSPIDQATNDFYQLGFGIACGATFLVLRIFDKEAAWLLLVLLLGYVEDTLYYLILPAFSPVFEFRGLPEVVFGLPQTISGWLGWLSRALKILFETPAIALSQLWYLFLNVVAIAAFVGRIEWLKQEGEERCL